MKQRNSTLKPSGTQARRHEALKDEVYRQMYRLEASRPGAELSLAIALLRAWIAATSEAGVPEWREWLMTISSICLPMIETAKNVFDSERKCIQ
jgi:hypothetical protein